MTRGEHIGGRETREHQPVVLSVAFGTHAAPYHLDRDEDGILGNVAQIESERAVPPVLETRDKKADLAAIREAGDKEAAAADALRARNVYGLFDGVSGSSGNGSGLIGSRLAAGAIAEKMAALPQEATAEQSREWIEQAMRAASTTVIEYQQRRRDVRDAATTADIIRLINNGDGTCDVAFGHAGDSRIYVFDGETRKLGTMTVDDSMAGEALRKGSITRARYDQVANARSIADVPLEDRDLFENRNIVYKIIGLSKNEQPATGVFRVKTGDTILMTTDGVHDNLTDPEIEEILKKGGDLPALLAAATSVAEGKSDRAKPDDTTAVMIKIGG